MERYKCKCERCQWEWISDKLPNACARCKTTAWNSKKKEKNAI